MKENNTHKIIKQTICFGKQDMIAYIEGDFSPKEQHYFEKHLQSCKMCHDEFEGLLAMQDYKKLPVIVGNLNKKVDNKIQELVKNPFFNKSNFLRIAAMLLILIGSGFFINYYMQYSVKEFAAEEMVSQSIEETAEETEMLVDDSFLEPETEESIPISDEKIEDKKDNSKSNLVNSNNIIIVKENKNKTKVLIEAIEDTDDDEVVDIEVNTDIKPAAVSDKTKNENEPLSGEANRGEGLDEKKDIIAEIIVTEEDLSEAEKEISNDEISSGNGRKLDNNINRAKLLSTKKNKTKGAAISYQQTGVDAFNDGNYKKATIALNNSVKLEGKADKTLFYLGQTYASQGDSKNALLNYNKLIVSKNSQYQNQAMWEKAQLLISIGKRKSAINVLNDLLKQSSPFEIKAQQKLDSLLTN